ncbi:alpha/beta hydrolase [bacterium]|nr:alpha/beta hydrolase [bacterium]
MKRIVVPHGSLAVFEDGEGTPVVFLHGGPGDTHHYMRRMAEPLRERYRCVCYDQRGTGESLLESKNAITLALPRFFDDLMEIREHLGVSQLTLVGHSWGAMLALLFAQHRPEAVAKAALLSMGPLDEEQEKICSERSTAAFSDLEKEHWSKLRNDRNEALRLGDHAEVLRADQELMRLRVKSWVCQPGLRDTFLEEYFRDPPPDRAVNKLVWEGARGAFNWEGLRRVQSPLLVCYGEEDFAPVGQGEKVLKHAPHAELVLLPQCGHIPWLEQPARFYEALNRFLN